MKKGLVLGIVLTLTILFSIPTHGTIIHTDLQLFTSAKTILYVGGDGSNNYTTIQEAITYASNGDTIFVYDDSSPYFEHVVIDKSIHLIGEDKTRTIIDGENTGDVVIFDADNITITGFTVQHSGENAKSDAGIESRTKNDIITGNRIILNGAYAIGIFLNGSSNNQVTDNDISENGREGVFLQNAFDCIVQNNVFTHNGHCAVIISSSSRNMISRNNMSENYATVSLWPGATDNEIAWNLMRNQEYSGVGIWPEANDNYIHHNYLSNISLYGFILTRAQGNIIVNNTIWGSNEGIHLTLSNKTTITFNNFIKNNISAYFENSSLNRWKQNYWDDHSGFWPKCIKGLIRIPWNKTIVIHWINIDWVPARKPYEIPQTRGDVQWE